MDQPTNSPRPLKKAGVLLPTFIVFTPIALVILNFVNESYNNTIHGIGIIDISKVKWAFRDELYSYVLMIMIYLVFSFFAGYIIKRITNSRSFFRDNYDRIIFEVVISVIIPTVLLYWYYTSSYR